MGFPLQVLASFVQICSPKISIIWRGSAEGRGIDAGASQAGVRPFFCLEGLQNLQSIQSLQRESSAEKALFAT